MGVSCRSYENCSVMGVSCPSYENCSVMGVSCLLNENCLVMGVSCRSYVLRIFQLWESVGHMQIEGVHGIRP